MGPPHEVRSDDPSHHERTLLPRSYISLLFLKVTDVLLFYFDYSSVYERGASVQHGPRARDGQGGDQGGVAVHGEVPRGVHGTYCTSDVVCEKLHIESLMSCHLLLNLLHELANMILCEALPSIISFLPTNVINLVINDNEFEILFIT